MRLKLLIALALPATMSFAQNYPGNQQWQINYAMVPSTQSLDGDHIGVLEPTLREYQNTKVTGAPGAQYQYFVSKRIGLYLYASAEQERGNWFTPYYYDKPEDWETLPLGTFSRTGITLATGFTCTYHNVSDDKVRIYSELGIGTTYERERDVFQSKYYNNADIYFHNNHPVINLSGNETVQTVDKFRLNAYYSPFGITANIGKHVAWNLQLGLGYKGLINFGLAYRIHTLTKKYQGLQLPYTGDVLVLPMVADGSYGVGSARYIDPVFIKPRHHFDKSFDVQMDRAIAQTKHDGGNILMVSRIKEGWPDAATIKGSAYYSPHADSIKAMAEAHQQLAFKNTPCAYIVLFRPTGGYDRPDDEDIMIGDADTVTIPLRGKSVYKVSKEGAIKIGDGKNFITVDVQFGHYYYIKTKPRRRGAIFKLMDARQGWLESALIK